MTALIVTPGGQMAESGLVIGFTLIGTISHSPVFLNPQAKGRGSQDGINSGLTFQKLAGAGRARMIGHY